MDGNRFDDLSRNLAGGASRRKVLKGLVAGLLGALGLRATWPRHRSRRPVRQRRLRRQPGNLQVWVRLLRLRQRQQPLHAAG